MGKFCFKFCGYLSVILFFTGCGVYSFRDVGSIPDGVKTVKIAYIDNRAPYINTNLAPQLNDAFVKIVANQTKLRRIDDDNANYVINATINQYSVSTSGVSSNSQASQDRLTVGVHLVLNENYTGSDGKQVQDSKEFDVAGNYDFDANLSLQTAETKLLSQMVKDLSESMFNKIFSNW
ncbi:MAG: LPS assembly lipoprotein LptE [Arachidicoccus sp.]|nr:LPS assembly lipoprotein LptE [Arachidicoccus sp.]